MISKRLSFLTQPHTISLLGAAICVAVIVVGILHFFHSYQALGNPRGKIPGYHYISEQRFANIGAAEMARAPGEGTLGYVARMNQLVHLSTYHCNPTDYSLSVVESVTSALMNLVGYRFDWRQGLFDERMLCGFCHQRAIILSRLLEKQGLSAMAYGVNGHVVTLLHLEDGAEYLVDPDYGAPPYRYDVSNSVLRQGFDASYAQTPFRKVDHVFQMVASRDDNQLYLTPDHIAEVQADREVMFRLAPFVAYVFIIGGALGLIAVVVLYWTRGRALRRVGGKQEG